MKFWSQELYLNAWNFASQAHSKQKAPGTDLPYIHHIGCVAMEVISAILQSSNTHNPDLALQCALLHDTIEDTDVTYQQLTDEFGQAVADGVLALSKDLTLTTKAEQMQDSLARIRKQPKEVWMVKLADRISNLYAPPYYWKRKKIKYYRDEALIIHQALGEANQVLSTRLYQKIKAYQTFIEAKSG